MTKEQLIENANKKGFKVNLEYPDMVGVNKGKHMWHWFRVYFDGEVLFYHSYSQNTGKSKKGTMHAISVQTSLGFYDDVK